MKKIYPALLFLLFGLLPAALLHAQERKHSRLSHLHSDSVDYIAIDTTVLVNGVPQRDLYDAIKKLIHHKRIPKSKSDSITSKPVFTGVPAIGYTLASHLALTLSGNAAFRLAPDTRISTVTASAAFTQRQQFTMPVESNIWTKGNKYNIIGDYRYYKYPQSTYGLGSNSNINNEIPLDYHFVRFYQVVMRQIKGNLYAGAGYIMDLHYDITDKGPLNNSPDTYKAYDPEGHTISSGFTLNALFDSRDNSINPSRGFYASSQYRQNYGALGSTQNWNSLIVDVRKYFRFPASSQNTLAFWSYNWLVLSGKTPYLDLPSTSWDPYSSTGRGYIQGRFRGTHMVYGESEYRFRITANGLLGGVVFANVESFSAASGSKLQTVQPGFGPGVRLKLNKISKTNICIDYGFGRENSKGLFINVGELF